MTPLIETKQPSRITLAHRLCAVAMMAMLVSHAEAATLRAESLISGANVTVGDLFEGEVPHGDYALAPAPKPGKTMVLKAADLTRVATTFGIDWKPASGFEQVSLKSANVAVTRDELLKLLQAETADMNVELQLPEHVSYFVPADGALSVESFTLDDTRETFTARVVMPEAGGGSRAETLTGRAFSLVQVPVLKTALKNGDMVGPADIEYVTRRQSAIPADTLLDETRIVGMTPRRSAGLGQPLQANDLESPTMVKKGQVVTMTLKNGQVSLSLQGRAMQSGSQGDVIRVLNPASNQMVEGTVSGFQSVTVAAPSRTLLN